VARGAEKFTAHRGVQELFAWKNRGFIRSSNLSPGKISVADPDPGSGAFLTPGSGTRMVKKSGSGSGMNNPDHISESSKNIFLG
jgi:hypothetical protein